MFPFVSFSFVQFGAWHALTASVHLEVLVLGLDKNIFLHGWLQTLGWS